MKKIMCITVSAIIVLSLNIFVAAQDFTDNYGKPGGAICIDDHSIVPDNTSFSNNYDSGNGGAIYYDGDPVNPGNTSFENNYSNGNGGAIYYYGNHQRWGRHLLRTTAVVGAPPGANPKNSGSILHSRSYRFYYTLRYAT